MAALRGRRAAAAAAPADAAWCGEYSGTSAGSAAPTPNAEAGSPEAWVDAGITSSAQPWSWPVGIFGTFVALSVFVAAFPVLLTIALLLTLFEAIRFGLGLDPHPRGLEEGSEEDVTLVMPGTCVYAFWQLGMVQYVCEHFDTRGAKLAGASSGAVGAVFILALEEAAAGAASPREAAERVRWRAQEIYSVAEPQLIAVTNWPLAFLSRLGATLDRVVAKLLPTDTDAGDRIRIGVRRLPRGVPPALVPDVVTGFRCAEDLAAAASCSSTVWLLVRAAPAQYLQQLEAFCGDGVNPFSFFCFVEYVVQRRSGLAAITAPAHTHTGGLDMIYAMWNCGVMRHLLPRRGRHIWLTPTVGGRLHIPSSLRFSASFLAQQWRDGYAHARDLDREGYFAALPRRAF